MAWRHIGRHTFKKTTVDQKHSNVSSMRMQRHFKLNLTGKHSRIIISLDNQLRLAAEGGHPQLAHQILVRQVSRKTYDLLLLYFKFI